MISWRSPAIYAIYTLIIFFIINLFAQDTAPDKSNLPIWILILPGTISESAGHSLENELTTMVTDIAWESGQFEVFDRFDVRELLMKYRLDRFGYLPNSVVLALGDSIDCDEAIIVDLLRYSQIGVPSEYEETDPDFLETIIDSLLSTNSDDYSDNIHTRISVQFTIIDLVTDKEIDRFSVQVSHTGGTRNESKEIALDKFNKIVYNEIRIIYQIVSEVVAVDGVNLDLRIGSNLGITGGTLFEIIEPDWVKKVGDEEVVYPGKPAGLACVQSVGDTVNHALVIRQWSVIEPGFYGYEFNKKINGIQIYFLPGFPGDYIYIGGQFHYSPLGAWDFGGGIHYTYATDSYDEKDHGFGFGIFGSRKLFTLTSLIICTRMGFDLDLPFKKDDYGKTVVTAVISGTLGISCSFMLIKKSDFELNLGYRLSTKSSNWTYSEDETEYDAFWYDAPPVVDLSGFYFTVGYKYLMF